MREKRKHFLYIILERTIEKKHRTSRLAAKELID